MPDPSADRPLPLPEKIKGFTEEDVELVSNVMLASNRTRAAEGLPTPAWCDLATATLGALAAAGRLMPVRASRDADLYGTAFIYTDSAGVRHVLKPSEVTVILRPVTSEEASTE